MLFIHTTVGAIPYFQRSHHSNTIEKWIHVDVRAHAELLQFKYSELSFIRH